MIKEKVIVGNEYPLKGELIIPKSNQPVPAVVFVHGSGASNMDEKVGKLTPFKDIAEGLARHGIASIRYDKRSYAHGFKLLMKEKNVTVKIETIDDAIMATNLLKNDLRIDANNVYIIGHSMGAMLAARIDSEGGNYKGLVMMAGSPRTLNEIMIDQNNDVLSQTKGFTHWIVQKQVEKIKKMFEGFENLSDEEAKKKKMGNGVTLYYFKEMNAFDTKNYLKKISKPMLIMQGEKDFQATVDKDFTSYKQLLEGKDNVVFKLYENLNHAFVPSIYGSIMKAKQEYNVEQHIGENVISDIANWIKRNSF